MTRQLVYTHNSENTTISCPHTTKIILITMQCNKVVDHTRSSSSSSSSSFPKGRCTQERAKNDAEFEYEFAYFSQSDASGKRPHEI